jgi:hypothetical protein
MAFRAKDRWRVLARGGARKTYRLRFRDSLLQPYVIMLGLRAPDNRRRPSALRLGFWLRIGFPRGPALGVCAGSGRGIRVDGGLRCRVGCGVL